MKKFQKNTRPPHSLAYCEIGEVKVSFTLIQRLEFGGMEQPQWDRMDFIPNRQCIIRIILYNYNIKIPHGLVS